MEMENNSNISIYNPNENSETIKNHFYNALKLKYQSQIEESLGVLTTYFNKSVGIGEHSDLMLEIDNWITKLSDAEGKLETLENMFKIKNK